MRKVRLLQVASLLSIFSLFFVTGEAEAQLYGLLHPAKPVRQSSLVGGGYLLLAGGADIGLVGQLRHGVSRNMDIGGKLGFLSEGDGGIMLGGDIMGEIVHAGKDSPFNLSLDGSIELFFPENVTIFAINGAGIIDDVFHLENGKDLRPYGAIALDIVTFDPESRLAETQTDLEISLIGGIVYGVSSQIDILGEIQISSIGDAEVGLNAGLNFR